MQGWMMRRSMFVAIVLASSAPIGASSASAQDAVTAVPAAVQVPASAYARAEALLPQHVRKLIYGMSVRPRWIALIISIMKTSPVV